MNYLLMVQLKADSDIRRIQSDVPAILGEVSKYSNDTPQLAYRSPEGQVFGVLFSSDRDPRHLQEAFNSGTFFMNGDGMVVVEVGKLRCGLGLSKTWAWLQHHN